MEGLLLQEKKRGWNDFLKVKELSKKVIVLAINFTNRKIAGALKNQGVPLTEDESAEESKMRHLTKIANFSLKHSGGERVILTHHFIPRRGVLVIGDTGKPLFQQQGVKIVAAEIVNQILAMKGRRIFLQTHRGVTQMGLQRRRPPKYKAKLWSWPLLMEQKPKTKGFLEVTSDKLPGAYKELTDAVFFVGGIFNNFDPPGISIELTGRQPEGEANYSLQLRLHS